MTDQLLLLLHPKAKTTSREESISIEKVLQLSNISTKLVLALGVTYQVGKPQLIKKRILRFRERRALDDEEAGQDLSHRYYWTRFELSWLSSAVGNRCDRPNLCSFFIRKLKPRAGNSQSAYKRFCSSVISAQN